MKILQLAQSFLPRLGGMELVVHHLSNALVERGHEVVTLAAEPALPDARTPDVSPARYRTERYPFGRRFWGLTDRNAREIRKALRRIHADFPFDVIHAHAILYPGYAAIPWARRRGVGLVITDHGWFRSALSDGPLAIGRLERWKTLRAIQQAPCLTAPGAEAFAHLMAHRACPEGLSRVLPNGAHTPSPGAMDRQMAVRGKGPCRRILMVGRNAPVKNYGLALEGLRRLRDAGRDVRLEILGQGVSDLAPLAQSLAVASWLDVGEPVGGDALWQRYGRADVFWMTSHHENMPLAQLEAFCFALPGVYHDAPGVRDLVREGQNGLLFQTGSADHLAAQTARLLDDSTLRAALGAGARTTGLAYRWPEMVVRYEALYSQVLGMEK